LHPGRGARVGHYIHRFGDAGDPVEVPGTSEPGTSVDATTNAEVPGLLADGYEQKASANKAQCVD
jgi:hypothetical protein